ncbi:DUF433 domain-containing protein [Egibacter rhizosphaerae]|uniref:DUF433 domain-containing protein n=1 Tax=Egibacter rhizosphaerae TaxID=1670831 RepID=A0A411YI13_9ACTN|nr:DUF433 domain-containing protein [Egibacter rhizosphaerae]
MTEDDDLEVLRATGAGRECDGGACSQAADGSAPCIRGLRVPVASVVATVADGMTADELVAAYPDLEREDVADALHYAADALRERARRRSLTSSRARATSGAAGRRCTRCGRQPGPRGR